MRICYIADATSPHTRGFLLNLTKCKFNNEIIVISTRYCSDYCIGSAKVINISSYPGIKHTPRSSRDLLIKWIYGSVINPKIISLLGGLAYFIDYQRLTKKVCRLVNELQPDIVHGIRLHLEGALASATGHHTVASTVWGHEFVLYSRYSIMLNHLFRKSLKKIDLIITDNTRDTRLAFQLGLAQESLSYVMPSQGGVDLSVFHPINRREAKVALGLDPNRPLIASIRGFVTAIIRTDILVQAIPLVLKQVPQAQFLIHGGTKHVGLNKLESLSKALNVQNAVHFTTGPTNNVAKYLKASEVFVSVASFDGVPMSMLEAMACGCIPVMSDFDSIQEWIEHGQNGYLFDPNNPSILAQSILMALNCNLEKIRRINEQQLIERANPTVNLSRMLQIYEELTTKRHRGI